MSHVTHINLLQRTTPAHTLGWATLVLFVVTIGGLLWYGAHVWTQAQSATSRRDGATQQLSAVKAQLAAKKDDEAKNAAALALRREVESLQPAATVAQALVDALTSTAGASSADVARTMTAMTGVPEPGLWLTSLSVSSGGKKLELAGEASNGAAVLRFAHRTNEALKPLTLRLDNLELQPAAGAAAANGGGGGGGASGAVTFRLN